MKHLHCFAVGRTAPGKPSWQGILQALLFLVLVMFPEAVAGLPADPEKYRQWEEESLEEIAELRARPSEANYEKLTRWVHMMSLPNRREAGGRPVFSAAREAMVSFPDHAEYLRRLIEASLKYESSCIAGKPCYTSPPKGRYETFPIVGLLRSPACISLLGDYIEDERDPWKGMPPAECSGNPDSNRNYALRELERMGIEGVYPARTNDLGGSEARCAQWKVWMKQVRAGIRSYRFEGDSQHYLITGPVAAALIPPLEMSQPFLPIPDPEEVAWIENRQVEKAVADWRDFMKETVRHPTQESVMRLVHGFSDRDLDGKVRMELREERQRSLTSIPNYTTYIENEIRAIFDEEIRAVASLKPNQLYKEDKNTPLRSFSTRLRMAGILASLRRPEIVGMLCKFLDDDRDPWQHMDFSNSWEFVHLPPVSIWAAETLSQMGVEPIPPTPKTAKADRQKWKNRWKRWGDQVEGGVRIYRFKGDPQSYDLNGPVAPFATTVLPPAPDSWSLPVWLITFPAIMIGASLAVAALLFRKGRRNDDEASGPRF